MIISMKTCYLSSLAIASSVGAKTVKCPVGSSNRGSKPGNDISRFWSCWQIDIVATTEILFDDLFLTEASSHTYPRPWVPLRTWQIQSRCWESDQGCSWLAGSSGEDILFHDKNIMITTTKMTKTMMTASKMKTVTLSTTWTIPLVARMSLAVIRAQLAITTLALCRWGGGGCKGSRSSHID